MMKFNSVLSFFIQAQIVSSFRFLPSQSTIQRGRPSDFCTTILFQSPSGESETKLNIDANNNVERYEKDSKPLDTFERSSQSKDGGFSELNISQMMTALGTSPRRIFLGTASSAAIALAADFGGVTGKVLSMLPEDLAESSGLDTYYPRGDFKRFKGYEYGYTFVYPKQWVGDTALELAKAQRRTRSLDYTMKNGKKSTNTLPDAAFGPPGKLDARGLSNSDTNVSVVASPLPASFQSIRGTLGSPEAAAETLLRVSLAPEGSGKKGTLLDACEENRGTSPIYQFEYLIDRGEKGVPLRAISAIVVKKAGVSSSGVVNVGNTLITFTVVAPKSEWENESYAAKLKKVAQSFKLR